MKMANYIIPTIDLSLFFGQCNDNHAKTRAKEIIEKACSESGFFQVINHGIPIKLMNLALDLSKAFFELPMNEKSKYIRPDSNVMGYFKREDHCTERNESFTIQSGFKNLENPPEYREVLEEMITHFTKAGQLIEEIFNDCLGLPPNFLQKYNNNRSHDVIRAARYFSGSNTEKSGLIAHEDSNSITFVLQDEIGGLEIKVNGEWIAVIPSACTLIVNVCDVIQVLSNGKFKSGTHRVVQPKEQNRYSIAFFYNLHGDKWVEPLPQCTKDIGEEPKYRGYYQKDYQQLKEEENLDRPSNPEDIIHIDHYAVRAKPSTFLHGSKFPDKVSA